MSKGVRKRDQEINLEDLTMQLRDSGRAAEAASIMDKMRRGEKHVDLSVLLRHHSERTITSAREIRQRDSFDYLLAFYSILEIATLIGFVPHTLPRPLAQRFLSDLKNPHVRRYYEKHYQLLLPRLARLRLEGKLSMTQRGAGSEAQAMFLSFLSIESRSRHDEDMEMFLWFLDDGYSNGFGLEDALAALGNRTRFVKRMLRPENRRDDCDTALGGFGKLLAFCVDFDSLLKRCDPWPLFQSALWHYYAYWFDLVKESVGSSLREAIRNVASWESEQTDQENRVMQRYMDEVTGSVDRLLSGKYGEQMRRRAADSLKTRERS